ncbi:MAG: dCTP deaminase [bacterium]
MVDRACPEFIKGLTITNITMVLSDKDIKKLIENKRLGIEPFDSDDIRESSVKLHLDSKIIVFDSDQTIDLQSDDNEILKQEIMIDDGYILKPNEFVLACTKERVKIPNGIMGWIETRGSYAKIGLQAHFCDAHIDPGSDLKITLQLKNNSNHKIKIYTGLYVVKMYLFQMSSDSEKEYDGEFQNSDGLKISIQ